MKLEDYTTRISNFRQKLFEIITAEPLSIKNILRLKPRRFNMEGVYMISSPDDSEIVYVGRTQTKSVIGRTADHKNIDTKSDLKGILKLHSNYPQEIDNYLVRCIELVDDKERTWFEHFAIGVLKPRFNK